MDVFAEVVTYDPIRRKGFLKALEPAIGSIHFFFNHLPDEVKLALDQPTRRLKKARERGRQPADGTDDFPAASRAVKAIINRQCFTMDISQRQDGKWIITRGTMLWMPEPAWSLGGQVRIRELKGTPETYDGWSRNQRRPQVGDVGVLLDFLHAPGIPDHYVVESVGRLEDGRPFWLGDFRAEELESR